jgi:hypothetical protein
MTMCEAERLVCSKCGGRQVVDMVVTGTERRS